WGGNDIRLRHKQDARSACGATTPGWHRQSIPAETATQNPCTPRGCVTGALCISRIRLITHVRTGALGGRCKICLRRSTYQKHGAFDVQLAGRPYRSCHRSKQGYRSWNRAPFRVCWLFCSRVKTHKVEMSLWFAAFRILLPDALTQNLRVASDTYTFMSLDPNNAEAGQTRVPVQSIEMKWRSRPHASWPGLSKACNFARSLPPFGHGPKVA